MKCPKCGNKAQDYAVFCDQCGARLERVVAQPAPVPSAPEAAEAEIACAACGASITPGELFCSECGAPLASPQPETVAAEEIVAATESAAPASAPSGGLACPVCGTGVAADDTSCYACGADLKESPACPAPTVSVSPSVVPSVAQAPPAAPGVAQASEQPAVPAPAQPEPAPEAPPECPTCGATVTPDDAFCEFCGAALIGAAAAVTPQADSGPSPVPVQPRAPQPSAAPIQPAPVAIGPRLVVASSGVEIPLPGGREALVGREDPHNGIFPDVGLTPYGGEEGGVSRRHFRIAVAASGGHTIEDLNSTNFTMVNRQRINPGAPVPLRDGDEIRAGRVRLVFKAGS